MRALGALERVTYEAGVGAVLSGRGTSVLMILWLQSMTLVVEPVCLSSAGARCSP